MVFTPTHGMTDTPVYKCWGSMKHRITNPANPHYKDYGGRGLDIDPRWEQFENFLADMGDKHHGKSIERRDNDRGYWPDNCYWATQKQQTSNRRSNRYLVINGERLTCADIARKSGCKPQTIHRRLANGWSPELLLLPPDGTKRHIPYGTGIDSKRRSL